MVIMVVVERVLGLGEGRAGFLERTAVGMRRIKIFDCVL